MIENAVWDADEMASIRNVDRMLPSQPYFSKMYKGKDFYGDMESLLGSMYEPMKLDIQTKDGLTYACMGSDLNTLRFYQFLINTCCYRRILEFGTYIGVSAMYLAETGARVTTIEKGREFYEIAKRNIEVNGFKDKISIMNSDAIAALCDDLCPHFDLIIIDCAKESYKELLELSLPLLTPDGIILVDDVFFQGDTLNKEQTSEKGRGVKAMLDYVATLDGYEKVILPLGNGLLMLRRK